MKSSLRIYQVHGEESIGHWLHEDVVDCTGLLAYMANDGEVSISGAVVVAGQKIVAD